MRCFLSNKSGLCLSFLAAVFFIALLMFWQLAGSGAYQPPRLENEDGAPVVQKRATGRDVAVLRQPPAGAKLEKGTAKPAVGVVGQWLCFRGKDRSNVSKENIPLARKWPESGPPVLWKIKLGQGYAAPAIRDGHIYLFDYDEEKQLDVIRCLSLADGKDVWRFSYPESIKRNHGISRTVIALEGEYLIGISPLCKAFCLRADTGEFVWMLDMVKQLGTQVPGWYAGQCPLTENGRAILAPSGTDVLMLAIDCASGEIIWKTPNPFSSQMSHASITPMDYDGRRLYVYPGNKGVVAVDAADGNIVWKTDKFKWHTIAPSGIAFGGDRLVFSAGYGAKAALFKLNKQEGKVVPELLKQTPPRVFGSEQQTPVDYKGHLYVVLPKPRQELICTDYDLNELWRSTPENRFGLGPYMIADGMIFLMNDTGAMTLAEATHEGYRQLARAQVIKEGHDSWGPIALAEGRMLVRDLYSMYCIDVRKSIEP